MSDTLPLREAIENALVRHSGGAAEQRMDEFEMGGELIAKWISAQLSRMLTNESDRDMFAGIGELLGHINSGLAHYAALLAHNVELAAAVGACTCWGKEIGCDLCHGCGAPGWEQPDQDLFLKLIAPALRRITTGTV